jgi:prolyl oligopeptidase
MKALIDRPPFTPVEPVVETLHGVEVVDPYRWLEEQTSPRTRKWLEEQKEYTRAYLDVLPGRDRIRARVEELLAAENISDPWKVGNRLFYLKRIARGQQPRIMMRETESGEEVALVDPEERDEGASTTVRILGISEHGNVLAYSVSHGGDSFYAVEFVDVSRKQVLADRLPYGGGHGIVLLPDGTGYYYSHNAAKSARPHYRAVCFHKVGSEPAEDQEIFFAGEDHQLRLELSGSSDGRFLGYCVVWAHDPHKYAFYIQDLSLGASPRKLLEQTGSWFMPCFARSRVFALTDWEAPNLRVVGLDLNNLEHHRWTEVVPNNQHRVLDFCIASDRLFVVRVENHSSRIEAFDFTGKPDTRVSCPRHGTVNLAKPKVESDTLFYAFSSFDRPWTIFSWQSSSTEVKAWALPVVPFEPSIVHIQHCHYRSRDGTEIPVSIVRKKDLQTSSPLPTFLTGYGGFAGTRTPQFHAYAAFLIENGFQYVVPNLRGGAEFGAEWHEAARRHKRQTAIDDFVCAAEWLVTEGFTIPTKLAIGGMSNGGLLVAAAMIQRPDLFRIVVSVGPLLDMLRYHLFDFSCYFVNEFGSSEDPADFRHLLAYSPYHRVRNDVSYPSVLIVSGDLDRTSNPMHARKMTARLQQATNSGQPILLDYNETWGHLPAQPLTRRIAALTDRLAFICHELGVAI